MRKADIKKKTQEFVDKYTASNIEKIYLREGYVNGMMDLAYKLGIVISDETNTNIKEVNIKDRLTKPGIYYQVSGDDIVPIDFVKYFEVVHEDEEDCSNGETITYKKYRWLLGKIDEISKVCEEQYKDMQDENTIDFDKYWLNSEVLIVKMVNGKLTAKVR